MNDNEPMIHFWVEILENSFPNFALIGLSDMLGQLIIVFQNKSSIKTLEITLNFREKIK